MDRRGIGDRERSCSRSRERSRFRSGSCFCGDLDRQCLFGDEYVDVVYDDDDDNGDRGDNDNDNGDVLL